MSKKTQTRRGRLRAATPAQPDPVAILLAMPLTQRIKAVGKDLQSGADMFRVVDAFELAEALGVPQSDSPVNGEWSFTTYANRQTIEEYVDQGGDAGRILGWLESAVGSKRLVTLEKAFATLDDTRPSFAFLTAKERRLAEDTIAKHQIEANQINGMSCLASYCVKHGGVELWFEADVEDDGSCVFLRTPYDERDSKFRDLSNSVVDEW
jgi:hypothetical protein